MTGSYCFTALVCPTHSGHYRTNVLLNVSDYRFITFHSLLLLVIDILWLPFYFDSSWSAYGPAFESLNQMSQISLSAAMFFCSTIKPPLVRSSCVQSMTNFTIPFKHLSDVKSFCGIPKTCQAIRGVASIFSEVRTFFQIQ